LVPTTRDNFWLRQAGLEAALRLSERWSASARLEWEDTGFDAADPTYFDYSVARARWAGRYQPTPFTSVELAPHLEWLRAPLQRAEEFGEGGAEVEMAWIGARSYVSLSPAGGRREYRGAAGDAVVPVSHSDYLFVELNGLLDFPFGGGVRVRGAGSVRWEEHDEDDDDSRSLYFSLDLRRIF
jgi:hypothetical protein